MTDPARRYRAPEYERLLRAARRNLLRNEGGLTGRVGIKQPTEDERRAVIGLTGRHAPPDVREIRVGLAELDASLHAATGLRLAELLEALGPPLRFPSAVRADRRRSEDEALAAARASPLDGRAAWYRTWLGELEGDGTLGPLIANGTAREAVDGAVRVLEALDARAGGEPPLMLADLAVRCTGDTKGLHPRTALSRLVLRALALRSASPRPSDAEERRALWEAADVVVDDLASRVLVLNLPAAGAGLGEWLTGAARHGTAFHVTLQQLVRLPVAVDVPLVRVCENPAVLRRASGELRADSAPLLCTEGFPSAAFHRLAGAVRAGGGRLLHHGDFDWHGAMIVRQVAARHGARPWRMSAQDYAPHAGPDGIPLKGAPQPTPWDPGLAEAMLREGVAVYEESVADVLLEDLAR